MPEADRGVSRDILPTAATMIGVCITAISVIKLAEHYTGNIFADEILEGDSLLFLISAFISYLSMRMERKIHHLERAADIIFLIAIGIMMLAIISLAIELPAALK